MVTNDEATVKVSKWLLNEIELFVNKNKKNRSDFPSKRNFVDRALIFYFENMGVKIKK
ncbi:MAG: hypothetical protein PHX15_01420 [Candidatus Nanoarchaeia archaeon]|jgi:hypothetical protein|nr:hypothetical protein [Candidatus Nanoarchaeia archaeon]MDD3993838.1 hypothetical protein [Candidatus Nanoarchaeia archaeon]MDD4563651.1 hypothetical protein [Candidatus Nanoarchaeia archaeon]